MSYQDDYQSTKSTARQKAAQGVKAFMRKISFDRYVQGGMSPTDAARRVGIRVPPGRKVKAEDLSKILGKGRI